MKKTVLLFLTAALLLALVIPVAAAPVGAAGCGCAEAGAFGKGRGTQANPYIITTAEQLRHVQAHSDRNYKLGGDLDLADAAWTPICDETPFTGTLNGGRCRISGLDIRGGEKAGLFAWIGEGAYVHHLTLEGTVTASKDTMFAGGVAAQSSGYIQLVESKITFRIPANASAQAVLGGIAGENTGLISECTFSGGIEDSRANSGSFVGAIAGKNAPAQRDTLPVLITAHAGFAAAGGSGDKSEDNTIDNVIKSINLGPEAIEIDLRPYTGENGQTEVVLAHNVEDVNGNCPRLQEFFDLLMGRNARSGELNEHAAAVLVQLDVKVRDILPQIFEIIEASGFPWQRLILSGGKLASLEEQLPFWQAAAEKGVQVWASPADAMDLLQKDPAGLKARLDALEIPNIAINISYEQLSPAQALALHNAGVPVSVWTLNVRDVIDEYMNVGLYNMTTRLEEALRVREAWAAGLLNNRISGALPEAGSWVEPPARQETSWLLWAGIAAGLLVLTAASLLSTRRRRTANMK